VLSDSEIVFGLSNGTRSTESMLCICPGRIVCHVYGHLVRKDDNIICSICPWDVRIPTNRYFQARTNPQY
jgi:hypothetical protein